MVKYLKRYEKRGAIVSDNDVINKDQPNYNYIDVCNMLQVSESTIRDWCNFFDDLIKVRTHNMVRIFTNADIEKLAFIKYLVNDKKMSVVEAHNYCLNNGFKDSNCNIVILNNKEFIQEFAKIVLSKMDNRFDSLEQTLNTNSKAINELKANTETLQSNLTNLYEGISDAHSEDIKSYIDANTKIVTDSVSNNHKEYSDLKNEIKETKGICNDVIKEVKMISRVERHKKTSLLQRLLHKD